jgi:DNA-binding NtrC family response regulator
MSDRITDILIVDADVESRHLVRAFSGKRCESSHAAARRKVDFFLTEHKVRVLFCADDLPDLSGLIYLVQT